MGFVSNVIDKEKLCACLGNSESSEILSAKFVERTMAIVSDPIKLDELGSVLMLLTVVLKACGDGDTCVLNLRNLERTLRKPHITLKYWAGRLVDLGYITKEPAGPSGLRIQILAEKIPSLNLGLSPDVPLQQAKDLLQSLRVTVDCALAHGLEQLSAGGSGHPIGVVE